MFGFGVALLIFGAIAMVIAYQLSGGGGDLFAMAEFIPGAIGVALLIVGAFCCVVGLATSQ